MSIPYRLNPLQWIRDWIWCFRYCVLNNGVWFAVATATANVWRRCLSPHFNERRPKP